jgi:hypothetical protein
MDLKERLEKIQQRNLRVKHKKYATWPIEKKIEVVTQWLVLGNLRQVSAVSGVSYDLVRQWRGEAWWAELEAEIRQSQSIEMDTKLSKIVEKSLEATLDRVENGDFIYDQKSGQIRRKPASLRDVHSVAKDLLDRREILRKGVQDRNEGPKVSIEEHLKMLATQMSQWFEPKKQPRVIDAEDVTPKGEEDAISEEWEEGLQEGASLGTQEEAESCEGSSGAECSSERNDGQGGGSEGRR